MRYGPIDPQLFIQNRRNFVQHLLPASMAIFHANDIMPTNADGTMAFRQNSDLFYLSGVDQEESILLLFPDATLPSAPRNPLFEGNKRAYFDLGRL
jgi:Xaa-Pro aminopeptidase